MLRKPNRLVASGDGAEGSLIIAQQASLYSGLLSLGTALKHPLKSGRLGWVQVISGQVVVNGQVLSAGDGLGLRDEAKIILKAEHVAELLVFDLPQ